MEPAPSPPASSTPPPRHRPPWLTSLVLVLVPAAGLVLAVWMTVAWLNGTTAGLRALLRAAAWAVPSLRANDVEGSLREGFTIGHMVVDEPRWSVDATQLTVTPE